MGVRDMTREKISKNTAIWGLVEKTVKEKYDGTLMFLYTTNKPLHYEAEAIIIKRVDKITLTVKVS